MKIKPLSDKVVLRLKDPEEKTKGGIYLPETSLEETHVAEVVAVGKGRFTEYGQFVKPNIREGQTVLIRGKWSGDNVTVDGVEYKIVSENEILAVLENK